MTKLAVQFVENKIGKLGKKCDIIIDINGTKNSRVVIECKDSSSYSSNKITEEIEACIKNRDTAFGIFLFKEFTQIPTPLQPIKITNKYIVTSFENNSLYLAFRVTRLFAEKGKEIKEIKLPIDKIQKELEELKNKPKVFQAIHQKIVQIENSSSFIRRKIELVQ